MWDTWYSNLTILRCPTVPFMTLSIDFDTDDVVFQLDGAHAKRTLSFVLSRGFSLRMQVLIVYKDGWFRLFTNFSEIENPRRSQGFFISLKFVKSLNHLSLYSKMQITRYFYLVKNGKTIQLLVSPNHIWFVNSFCFYLLSVQILTPFLMVTVTRRERDIFTESMPISD